MTATGEAELELLHKTTGESKGQLGRFALIALGVIIRAKARGEDVHLVGKDRERVLELPIPLMPGAKAILERPAPRRTG